MALLFQIEGKVVRPTPEILLIEPFKTIWERDTSEGKEVAIAEFTYIEFMSSAKATNPFKGYPEEDKPGKIIEETYLKDINSWSPDNYVRDGIKYWENFQTKASSTYRLYRASKMACDKLGAFLSTISPNERDKNGKPVHKPRDITGALKDIDTVAIKLAKLKEKVEEELYEETRSRSNKVVSPFADPSSLK